MDREGFYFNIYNQRGGEMGSFKGSRFIQYGHGFGDVLRSIYRHVMPVTIKGNEPAAEIVEEPAAAAPTPEPQDGKGKARKRKKKRKEGLTRTTLYKEPIKKKKKAVPILPDNSSIKFNF